MEDVRWLGFDWEDRLYYASDYFEQIYEWAVQLIKAGKAYVCDLTADQIRETRGTLTEPGKNSPYRDRSVEENLDLFERMQAGEFPDGSRTLRAKIDMASPNLNMRDPVMYRILHATHHRTRRQVVHLPDVRLHPRPVRLDRADHALDLHAGVREPPAAVRLVHPRAWASIAPQQIEFARLNLTYTVMSKRRLLELVKQGYVSGWDDPRMPTICGLRRRGYTPEAIRDFCARIGVSKFDSVVDIALLEHCLRDDLNRRAPRVMAVLRPLKVVIDNYPGGPGRGAGGDQQSRRRRAWARGKVPFSRELYIEQDDFREEPPKKYLPPGARPGSAAALRLFRQLHGRGQRSEDRRGGRIALHLRSGHPRRQRARWPQGEGHDPLGLGGPRACRPRCGSTITCSPSPTPTTCRRARITKST